MFTAFLKKLSFLRERTARFRRVQLHVHSPDSHDWGREAVDAARNDKKRFAAQNGPQEFLQELAPNFDCVAVTDHMKCTFATQLGAATAGDNKLIVLPEMEVNFKPDAALGVARIHLLVILPSGATPEDFAALFPGQKNIPRDDVSRNGQEEIVGIQLSDWIRQVHEEGGICIAAHVESAQGIRFRFRQTAKETLKLLSETDEDDLEKANNVPESLRQYLLASGLDAVEIHKSEHAQHYRWESEVDGRRRSIATVLTSDPHNIEHLSRPERTTHIKMTRLRLPDLREALRFSDTRIRFPDNLPTPPSPRVLGIVIAGGNGSFFEDVTIALAENLNCLIGVRGSGKSTVVEAFRYVFGYNQTLDEIEALKNPILELQNFNLRDSIIRVAYRTISGDTRILEATFDERAVYATKVYTSTGDPVEVADVGQCGDYPLRLYGWSEIENLGREFERQRALLDRLIPELGAVLDRRRDLRNDLAANRGEVIKRVEALKAAFEANDCEIRRFSEYKADFEKQNTEKVKTLFSALDLAQAKRRLLKRLKSNATSLIDKMADLSAVSLRADWDGLLNKGGDALRKWWLEEEVGRLGLNAAEAEAQKSLQEATKRIQTFEALVTEHVSQTDGQVSDLEKKLRDEFAGDDSMKRIADLRTNAAKRLERSSGLRDAYLRRLDDLRKALESRRLIAEQLVHTQNEIAGIRARRNVDIEKTLNRFLPAHMAVSISFEGGGDTKEFNRDLKPVFGAMGKAVKRIRQVAEEHRTPVAFARMALESDFHALVGKAGTLDGVSVQFVDEDQAICIEKTRPFETDEHAQVAVLVDKGGRLEQILRFQETRWDDLETILLNGDPVNQKSPGQRSSAMLPLIALAESVPLIIDQPEDNLDKRLIGSVLMKVLAELKEIRQIIVCTHDPNILVGGDAEQVVVLDAEHARRGKVSQHGSIDNQDIVEAVISLLEGGAEAFETRRKRYYPDYSMAER